MQRLFGLNARHRGPVYPDNLAVFEIVSTKRVSVLISPDACNLFR